MLTVTAFVFWSSSRFTEGKSESYIENEIALRVLFAYHHEEVNLKELKEVTALCLDVGAMGIEEVHNPEYFDSRANDFGLKPGFVVDLQTGWDLRNPEHVRELEELQAREDPLVLIGSPPYQAETAKGRQPLKIACEAYQRKMKRDRVFLHELMRGDSWRKTLCEGTV